MFSDELLELVFANERLRGIPLAYQSAVIHAVEEEVERKYYTEHDLLKNVLRGGNDNV